MQTNEMYLYDLQRKTFLVIVTDVKNDVRSNIASKRHDVSQFSHSKRGSGFEIVITFDVFLSQRSLGTMPNAKCK